MSDEDKSIKQQAISWIAGQPFNNVLLVAILFCIGWGGYYTVTVGIPSHLDQIQNGYKSLTESHRDERQRTMELYDRWINKTSNATDFDGSKIANETADK